MPRPNIQANKWAGAAEVKVDVRGMPGDWGTLELYNLLSKYGNLARVEVYEKRNGRVNGYVVFSPPPSQPAEWLLKGLTIKTAEEVEYKITFHAQEARAPYMHPSPMDSNRRFPEVMRASMAQLDLGLMQGPDQMLVMRTVEPNNTVHRALEVVTDMRRKCIDLHLMLDVEDAERYFKIRIQFSQMTKVSRSTTSDGETAWIIDLDMPPQVFRKPDNASGSHDAGTKFWNEWQLWYRQIAIDSQPSATAATRLQKRDAILDLGRWLSYRLVFDPATSSSDNFARIGRLLLDHNIDINRVRDTSVVDAHDRTLWKWLNETDQQERSDAGTLSDLHLMSLSTPLTFDVRYMLEVCLSQGVLLECNVSKELVQALARIDPPRASRLLEKAADLGNRLYDPMDVFKLGLQISMKRKTIPKYCAMVPAAVITPTTIYFSPPAMETSNRIVRRYSHLESRFLRVKFTDERYRGRVKAGDDKSQSEVLTRVSRTMKNGIIIGDRHYEFLAFGNSQFREHGAYFFAPTIGLTAADIRREMGDLSGIKGTAKYASRLGQSFSTTRAMPIAVNLVLIPDIERNGFCFTDGVGKISPFLAQMVAAEYRLPNSVNDPPSVMQIRLGGCKGVLTVDPAVKGKEVHIRGSQQKFPAEFRGLEIIRLSQFSSAYLNMQLILVLSALGVPDWAFLKKADDALKSLQEAMTDKRKAKDQLMKNIDFNQTTVTLATMVDDDGFMDAQEPFTMSCMHLWRSWMVKYLKEKARILVEKGAFVLGGVDETGTLRGHYNEPEGAVREQYNIADLPEIFLQIPDPESRGSYKVVIGPCVLARNPSLHPGDVRVVHAVDQPRLRHLKNCVVLPQTGDRDLANMCSGGDLDGDDYLVMWDEELMPGEWNREPMNYAAPRPIVKNSPVTVDDITTFFVKHMKNDNLARIAVAHRYWADYHDDGIKCAICLELAQLHSQAVDYAKTGIPAIMGKRLRPTKWPHWAEPKCEPHKVYHSKKVLGQLYDRIQRVDFLPTWQLSFDKRILEAYEPTETMLRDARELKVDYDEAVRRIMAQNGIESEFEVWTTFVLKHGDAFGDWKFTEALGETVTALKDSFRETCYERAGTDSKTREWSKLAPFLAAMYTVTAQEVTAAYEHAQETKIVGGRHVRVREAKLTTMPFMSFPWIFPAELGRIANGRGEAQYIPRHTTMSARQLPARKPNVDFQGNEIILEPLSEITVSTERGVVHTGQTLDLFGAGSAKNDGADNNVNKGGAFNADPASNATDMEITGRVPTTAQPTALSEVIVRAGVSVEATAASSEDTSAYIQARSAHPGHAKEVFSDVEGTNKGPAHDGLIVLKPSPEPSTPGRMGMKVEEQAASRDASPKMSPIPGHVEAEVEDDGHIREHDADETLLKVQPDAQDDSAEEAEAGEVEVVSLDVDQCPTALEKLEKLLGL